MRRAAGIGLLALGLVATLLGAAAAVALGPDDRMVAGPHPVRTDDRAVVTRPSVLARYGPQVSVTVEVPDDTPVFVGLASTVDVDDYLAQTARVEVTRYRVPWTLRTRSVDGDPQLPAAPTAVDWWDEAAAGIGGAQLRFRLPDRTVSLAVLAVGDANLSGLTVTVAYELPGGFGVAVGVTLAGIGLMLLGLVLLRVIGRRRVRARVRRRGGGWDVPGLADDEWDAPWPETDPADADTWDDFLAEDAPAPVPVGVGADRGAGSSGMGSAAAGSSGTGNADPRDGTGRRTGRRWRGRRTNPAADRDLAPTPSERTGATAHEASASPTGDAPANGTPTSGAPTSAAPTSRQRGPRTRRPS